jgi:hypothetical protein
MGLIQWLKGATGSQVITDVTIYSPLPVTLRGTNGAEGDTALLVTPGGRQQIAFGGGVGDAVASAAAGVSNSDSGLVLGTGPYHYNGSTWDRQRGNTEGTLLASAARTAGAASANQTNHNARGVILLLDVTVAPAAPPAGSGLIPLIQAYDPISGRYVQLNSGTPTRITAVGTYATIVAPGIREFVTGGAPASYQVYHSVNYLIPRTWRGSVNVGNADSYTYSLGYALIL